MKCLFVPSHSYFELLQALSVLRWRPESLCNMSHVPHGQEQGSSILRRTTTYYDILRHTTTYYDIAQPSSKSFNTALRVTGEVHLSSAEMLRGPIGKSHVGPAVMRRCRPVNMLAAAMLTLYIWICQGSATCFLAGSCFTMENMERMFDPPATSDPVHDARSEGYSRELNVPGSGYRAVLVGSTVLITFTLAKRSRMLRRAMFVARRKVAQYSPRCIGRLLDSTPSFLNWRPPPRLRFGVSLGTSPVQSMDSSPGAPTSPSPSSFISVTRSVSMPTVRGRRSLLLPVVNRRAKTCQASVLSQVAASVAATGSDEPEQEPASQNSSLQVSHQLGEVFDACTSPGRCLCLAHFERVVDLLNERFDVRFQSFDVRRLWNMICVTGQDEVGREAFVSQMGTLLAALSSSKGLSLAQLRIIMRTAFERFDTDSDGSITQVEFAAALSSCDIHLQSSEVAVLLKFLSPSSTDDTVAVSREDLEAKTSPSSLEDMVLEKCVFFVFRLGSSKGDCIDICKLVLSRSVWVKEQFQAAFQGASKNLAEATGWNGAVKMAGRVLAVFEEPLSPKSQLYRVIAAIVGKDVSSEMFADTSELLTTLASIVLVLHAHDHGAQMLPAEWMDQLKSVADDLTASFNDLFDSGPMGPVLLSGVLGAFKALRTQEPVSLSEKEALLFARTFHTKGCSMPLFQKLLACGHCQWTSASEGDLLQDSARQEVQVLVRGEVQRCSEGQCMAVQPGEVIKGCRDGEVVVASSNADYATLDAEKLAQCVQNSTDTLLVELVKEILLDAGIERTVECDVDTPPLDVPASPESSTSGWLSPFAAALRVQAKRKGFSVCSEVTDGLNHILSQEDITLPAKLERCRALVLDNADVFVESLEALVDITGACSALLAFWTQSSAPTPEHLLQLAPIMILLSLVAVHSARRGAASGFSPADAASP